MVKLSSILNNYSYGNQGSIAAELERISFILEQIIDLYEKELLYIDCDIDSIIIILKEDYNDSDLNRYTKYLLETFKPYQRYKS